MEDLCATNSPAFFIPASGACRFMESSGTIPMSHDRALATPPYHHGELVLLALAGGHGQEARELVPVVKETQAGAAAGTVGLHGVPDGWREEEGSEVSHRRALKPDPIGRQGRHSLMFALKSLSPLLRV